MECILCYEKTAIMAITKCNHNCVCYKCLAKCRLKMKSQECPICKAHQDEVILSLAIKPFEQFDIDELEIYQ